MSYNVWLIQLGRIRANATGHRWAKWAGKHSSIPYPYCQRCGIIALNNEETRRHIRRGCAADFRAPGEREDGTIDL